MTQYAKFETKSAWLGTEFGESYARKIFGDEIVDALPRGVRGKNKGKLKQTIGWVKVIEGGWVKTRYDYMSEEGVGYVENRSGSTISWKIIASQWDGGEVLHSKEKSRINN